MGHRLQNLGIAHGDLQHGNIIVKNGKLHLIDYDGMFVPELSSLKSDEIGHRNYQHPSRKSSHYGVNIDRFSSVVIYLGLLALSICPSLWSQYDDSDNILFNQRDFVDYDSSPLLNDLAKLPQLSPLIERFRGVCKLDFDQIPTLDQFVAGNFTYPKVAQPISIAQIRSQYVVLDASRKNSLLEHFGNRVEVVGYISESHRAQTRYKQPYVFLNFGNHPYQTTFKLVLWSKALSIFQITGSSYDTYIRKWVSVIGVINSYGDRPQMVIEMPSQIKVLSGKKEAKQRLKQSITHDIPESPAKRVTTTADTESEVFNRLYANRTATPSRSPYQPQTPSPQTQKKSRCFVATATLGASQTKEIACLQWYRDNILSETIRGRLFIRFYNRVGPKLADFVHRSKIIKHLSLVFIKQVTGSIERKYTGNKDKKPKGG